MRPECLRILHLQDLKRGEDKREGATLVSVTPSQGQRERGERGEEREGEEVLLQDLTPVSARFGHTCSCTDTGANPQNVSPLSLQHWCGDEQKRGSFVLINAQRTRRSALRTTSLLRRNTSHLKSHTCPLPVSFLPP